MRACTLISSGEVKARASGRTFIQLDAQSILATHTSLPTHDQLCTSSPAHSKACP